ncbi:MAG TPA: carboxypeptidase-like regulatory domain-containing protein, partial [Longimicrobiales bacterium]
FPAERKLQDEARRTARLRSTRAGRELGVVRYPAATSGFALDWDGSFVLAERSTHGVVRSMLGASLLGGELEAGGDLGVGIDLQTRERIARFVRPFPNNRWIQQVTLGSLVAPTPVPRYTRGFMISNAPLIRPNDFQEIAYRPALPPGWTAEVYEGETLLGVSDATAPTQIPLPVGYGFTPVHVRILGPAGQERTEQLQYIVPSSRLPSRHVEYNAGIGECRAQGCRNFAFADVSRGVTAFTTLGGGLAWLRSDSADDFRPYGRFSLSPRPNLALEAQAEGRSHLHAAMQFFGTRNTSVSAAVSWFDPSDASLALRGTYLDLASAIYVSRRYVTASVQGHLDETRRLADAQLFLGTPVGIGFVGAQWNRTMDSPDLFGARMFWAPRMPGWIAHGITLSSSVSFSRERFEVAEFSSNVQVRATSYLNTAVQWRGGGGGAALAITYTVRSGFGTGQARALLGKRNSSMVMGVNGGLALAPGGEFTTSYTGTVGKAGVTGVTYLDANGNGVLDAGETALPGIPIFFEGQRRVSDQHGRFEAWDLPAVRTTSLSVDSLTLEDVRLTPLRPEFTMRLPANAFSRFDVPLIRTGEVIGRVTAPDRGALGGIQVELHASDGGIVLQTRTFTDGEFYFPRVPPGSYTAVLAPASLSALSAQAQPAAQTVDVPFTPGPAIRINQFILVPRP